MLTYADKIISFLKEIDYTGPLPRGISIMNPIRENPGILKVITQFYSKFYNDNKPRHLILGINPGRFGAGATGVPFTDTKRLGEKCRISIPVIKTYEPSSVFVYEMIEQYGGVDKFYSDFYINSFCPLGFTSSGKEGREINYNYYDNKKLMMDVWEFSAESIKKQIDFGFKTDVCFSLGTGKNYKYLTQLNIEKKFFNKIIPLEHPRYIMQYRSKQKQFYIDKYLLEFQKI